MKLRLIDADAEISKIKKEIKRIEGQIKKWEDNREDRGRYDVDAKISQLRRNISDARAEIRRLESYETAHAADKT